MAIEYFSEEQITQLVNRLTELTNRGVLDWRSLQESEYRFATRAKNNMFSISSRDSDDLAPHILKVFLVEGGKPREIQTIDSQHDVETEAADLIEELYQLVKRTTLNIDVVAKSILADLDALGNEDEPPF